MSITRTQTNHAEAAGTGSTIAVTLNGVAARSLVVHTISVDDAFTISSMLDDLSVAAAAGAVADDPANQRVDIRYHKDYGGGNRTFTATFSGSTADFRSLVCSEYAGADVSAPLEGTASNAATSATPTTNNLSPTPSMDGMLVVGLITAVNLPTFAAPFSNVFQTSVNNTDTEDLIQTAKAAVAATWTQTSANYAACACSFKPAVVGYAGRANLFHPGKHPRRFLGRRSNYALSNPPAPAATTILQRRTLNQFGTHTGGRSGRIS